MLGADAGWAGQAVVGVGWATATVWCVPSLPISLDSSLLARNRQLLSWLCVRTQEVPELSGRCSGIPGEPTE